MATTTQQDRQLEQVFMNEFLYFHPEPNKKNKNARKVWLAKAEREFDKFLEERVVWFPLASGGCAWKLRP